MITRNHRFHGYNALRNVYQRGQTVRGPLFAIKFVDNPRRDGYRLSVVVSKKVSKSAVKRNRIRRRLYEVVRLLEPEMVRQPDIALTVFAEQIAELPAPELTRAVRSQFAQASILPKKQRA